MICITDEEFQQRIARIQEALGAAGLHGMMVYGDEYRKENLRYVSNFWPIFERGACFIPVAGRPVLAGAPEGEAYAREMSVWDDIRNLKEFACVSVADEIDYPNAAFSSFEDILGEMMNGSRLGVVGIHDMPEHIMQRLRAAVPGLVVEDASDILNELRLIKSPAEIACLREAGRLACIGYEQLMTRCVPGNTELQAAGAAEGAARSAGAEDVVFTVMGTGARADTIIGRPVNRVMNDGDMVMAAFAVQYQGYVATVEYPFVVGTASAGQRDFLNVLFEATNTQLEYLRDGVIAGDMVTAVRAVFAKHGLEQFDVYPPMHGIGLAEAESPYPDSDSTYPLRSGMCVNSDISLFGHPHGSNRIEEGFVITDTGVESLTPMIRELCNKGV